MKERKTGIYDASLRLKQFHCALQPQWKTNYANRSVLLLYLYSRTTCISSGVGMWYMLVSQFKNGLLLLLSVHFVDLKMPLPPCFSYCEINTRAGWFGGRGWMLRPCNEFPGPCYHEGPTPSRSFTRVHSNACPSVPNYHLPYHHRSSTIGLPCSTAGPITEPLIWLLLLFPQRPSTPPPAPTVPKVLESRLLHC